MTQQNSGNFREDANSLENDVTHLRDWLLKQPHINGRTDDVFLLAFLRGCKYSLERAKEKIDTFYTMRTALPEFFDNRDPMDPTIQEILRLGFVLPLGRDAQGRRVVLDRPGGFNPEKLPAYMASKTHIMLAEVMMEEDGDQIGNGFVAVFDMKDVALWQCVHYTPALCKKSLLVYQNAFPLRPKAIHFVNLPPVLETFITLIKSILKEKLRQRITIHKNIESLFETIPREVLPEEYGGGAGTLQVITEQWRKKVSQRRDYFLEDEKRRVDESKRPGKPKTHEDLFGFEGSFRQLSVD